MKVKLEEFGKTTLQQLNNLKELAGDVDELQVNDIPLLSFSNSIEKSAVKERLDIQIQIEEAKTELRRKKKKEQIKNARKVGNQIGRKSKNIPKGFSEIAEKYKNGEVSQRKAGALLGVSNHTFMKWYKKFL